VVPPKPFCEKRLTATRRIWSFLSSAAMREPVVTGGSELVEGVIAAISLLKRGNFLTLVIK
jgi:hypothetical protein